MSLIPSTAGVVHKQQDMSARSPQIAESSYLDILKARESVWGGIRPLLPVRLALLAFLMSLPVVAVACMLRRPGIIALTFASLLAAGGVLALTFIVN